MTLGNIRQKEDEELAKIETERLFNELMRRYSCGVVYVERPMRGTVGNSGKERPLRMWGDPTWCIGACDIVKGQAAAWFEKTEDEGEDE